MLPLFGHTLSMLADLSGSAVSAAAQQCKVATPNSARVYPLATYTVLRATAHPPCQYHVGGSGAQPT